MLVSSALHVVYLLLLALAYRHGELSFAYPIARGSSPMLVTLGGLLVLRPRLSRDDVLRFMDVAAPGLLVAQGGNDPRVPESESRQIVDAMRARGQQVEYLCFPDEGHGFDRPGNRIAFYQRMERFLAAHIGRTEAA